MKVQPRKGMKSSASALDHQARRQPVTPVGGGLGGTISASFAEPRAAFLQARGRSSELGFEPPLPQPLPLGQLVGGILGVSVSPSTRWAASAGPLP